MTLERNVKMRAVSHLGFLFMVLNYSWLGQIVKVQVR